MLKEEDFIRIKDELTNDEDRGYVFKYQKLSNRFIDWIFNHYSTIEFTINYFDSFGGNEHNLDFCCWQEPYGRGINNLSQNQVDGKAKEYIKKIKKMNTYHRDRIYYALKGDYILIYWYGRDKIAEDYWWVLRKHGSDDDEYI